MMIAVAHDTNDKLCVFRIFGRAYRFWYERRIRRGIATDLLENAIFHTAILRDGGTGFETLHGRSFFLAKK